MASGSRSQVHTYNISPYDSNGNVLCLCREVAREFTSKTDNNPNRVFYKCAKLGKSDKCNFFKWQDQLPEWKPPESLSEAIELRTPMKRGRSNSIDDERALPMAKRSANDPGTYSMLPFTPPSSQSYAAPQGIRYREYSRTQGGTAQTQDVRLESQTEGRDSLQYIRSPTAYHALPQGDPYTDLVDQEDTRIASENRQEPGAMDGKMYRPSTPRIGQRSSNAGFLTHEMPLTPNSPVRSTSRKEVVPSLPRAPEDLELSVLSQGKGRSLYGAHAGSTDNAELADSAANLSPYTSSELSTVAIRLQATVAQIEKLERIIGSQKKSIEAKSARINELEGDIKRLENRVHMLEGQTNSGRGIE